MKTWDGLGPINWLNRIELGPQPYGGFCGAVTTPTLGDPVECWRGEGHDGPHECGKHVWPPRDWEAANPGSDVPVTSSTS